MRALSPPCRMLLPPLRDLLGQECPAPLPEASLLAQLHGSWGRGYFNVAPARGGACALEATMRTVGALQLRSAPRQQALAPDPYAMLYGAGHGSPWKVLWAFEYSPQRQHPSGPCVSCPLSAGTRATAPCAWLAWCLRSAPA